MSNETNETGIQRPDDTETIEVNGGNGEETPPLDVFFEFVQQNWFELAIVLGMVALLALAYKFYREKKPEEKKSFEETDIKKRVIENLKARGEFIGKQVSQPLYHGEVDKLGGVKWMIELHQPTEDHLTPGDLEDEDGKKIEEEDMERVYVFLLSKGLVQEMRSSLEETWNSLLGEETYNEEICAVPESLLTFRDDKIIINRNTEFDLNGGIKTARATEAANVVNEIIVAETNDLIRQSLADFTEPVNLLSKDHSQSLNKAEKLAELSDEPERVRDLFNKS